MSDAARYFTEIFQLKAIRQLSYSLDTGTQLLRTCLHLFVSNLTYTTDRRVIDFAVTTVSDDTLQVKYIKAVYFQC